MKRRKFLEERREIVLKAVEEMSKNPLSPEELARRIKILQELSAASRKKDPPSIHFRIRQTLFKLEKFNLN